MHAGSFAVVAIALSQMKLKLAASSQLATHDLLTGLLNGRAFYELATREMKQAFGLEPLTLAYIDVEGLESINHRLGYFTGTRCFVQSLKRSNRAFRGPICWRESGALPSQFCCAAPLLKRPVLS